MLGIIILNYNNTSDVLACVESLTKYTDMTNVRIVVVDNGSKVALRDAVESSLLKLFDGSFISLDDIPQQNLILPLMTYLKLPSNVGYARGNNAGFALLEKMRSIEYVMVLNSDILFTSDIITSLLEKARSLPDIGALSPLLYKPDGEIDYCCARRSLCKKDMLVTFSYLFNKKYKSALEKRKILRESPELINQDKIEIDLPSGSCMLFKRAVFEALGGFDEGTFLYYEEDILNKKIKQMGLKNVLIPSVNCIHVGGATTNNTKSAFFLKKCNYESLLYYLQKYESCTRLELCYFKLSASLRLGRLYLGRLYHKLIDSL